MDKNIKNILFYISAFLLVVSTALYMTQWVYVPYMYAVASAGVALYYLTTPYKGENVRFKRLHGYLSLAGLLLVVSSYLMFKGQGEWLVCLVISAFFQLYVASIRKKEEV